MCNHVYIIIIVYIYTHYTYDMYIRILYLFFSMGRHVCVRCERGLIMKTAAIWFNWTAGSILWTWECPFCAFWLAAWKIGSWVYNWTGFEGSGGLLIVCWENMDINTLGGKTGRWLGRKIGIQHSDTNRFVACEDLAWEGVYKARSPLHQRQVVRFDRHIVETGKGKGKM